MPTEPEEYPLWATDPPDPDDVSDPNTSRQEDGFMNTDYPVPYRWLNYLFLRIYEWIVYFNESIPGFPRYDTLEDAVSDLADDQVGLVDEIETDISLTNATEVGIITGSSRSIVSTGTHVVVASDTQCKGKPRSGSGTTITFTKTNSGSIEKIAYGGGAHLFMFYGTYVEAFLIADQTSDWVINFPGAEEIIDICAYGDYVFLLTAGGGSRLIYKYETVSGASNEVFYIVMGSDGLVFAANHDMIGVLLQNGEFKIYTEDNLIGTLDLNITPDAVNHTTHAKCKVVCDEDNFYLAINGENPDTAEPIYQIIAINMACEIMWQIELDSYVTSICCDQDYVFAAVDDGTDKGTLVKINKFGSILAEKDFDVSGTDTQIADIASDGFKLFAISDATAETAIVNRGNSRPRAVTKRADANFYNNVSGLAVEVERT